ncbi:MAG: phosphoribosylamine--glycine ligase [Acidimicrobiia bacterium]|nr:phosphoribosylamine--glycine ligase [Acidimicrobiia bacterium]
MKVLLIGSGAREHALAWKLAASPTLDRLLILPGNPGMARLGDTIEGVSPVEVGAVAAVAAAHSVDLAVIGPEAPLAAGVSDALRRAGVAVFGPSRSGARLESSKSFAKEVMARAGVPTAGSTTFSDPGTAHAHLQSADGPYVVKADGLAAGKGVLVTEAREEAADWVDACFEGRFGEAGSTVVIEEYLEGPELSVFAICDGTRHVVLEPARDYKRLADGDAGPNTGGMGSYSPVDVPADLLSAVARTVIEPTIATMADDGDPYIGFLYVGLALTADGPKVIEFNCRLGDPETQVVLPRLESDLLSVLEAAANGDLGDTRLEWSPHAAVNVVLASSGYPTDPVSGAAITGLDDVDDDVLVFHAGTRAEGRHLVTSGGRVLSVVGSGPDLPAARSSAYEAVDRIRFRGMQFRTDIAAG